MLKVTRLLDILVSSRNKKNNEIVRFGNGGNDGKSN